MNNYIFLLFFVLIVIISKPVTTRPGEVNTVSVEHVNKSTEAFPSSNLDVYVNQFVGDFAVYSNRTELEELVLQKKNC